jgi:flagellar motor switch protein FliN/FliY
MIGGINMAEETTPTTLHQEEIAAEETKDKGTEGWDKKAGPATRPDEPGASHKSSAKGEPKTAQFSPVQDTGKAAIQRGLDFILDIPLQVTVELGRTQMLVNDLLQLGQGSVVELSKIAGEPMEVLVNQKLIARGEVVVVNEKFGIRLTDVITPLERVEQLR